MQHKFVFCADLNSDLDISSPCSTIVNNFIRDNNLCRSDLLYPLANNNTYVNESLNVASHIDYIISSPDLQLVAFNILDLDINLSDHLPLLCLFLCDGVKFEKTLVTTDNSQVDDVSYFRWDRAPLHLYYEQTRVLLEPVLADLNRLCISPSNMTNVSNEIDVLYKRVVTALSSSADIHVPKVKKNFFKVLVDPRTQ